MFKTVNDEHVFKALQQLAKTLNKDKTISEFTTNKSLGRFIEDKNFKDYFSNTEEIKQKYDLALSIGLGDSVVNLTQDDILKILKLLGFTKEYDLQSKLEKLLTDGSFSKYNSLEFYNDVEFLNENDEVVFVNQINIKGSV